MLSRNFFIQVVKTGRDLTLTSGAFDSSPISPTLLRKVQISWHTPFNIEDAIQFHEQNYAHLEFTHNFC